MTKVTWDSTGKRFFEAGVDRGMLYVGTQDGVPWNGLSKVNENPEGGSVASYYMDGVKYLQSSGTSDYSATIEAFTYPVEFEPCLGIVSLAAGLLATQQTPVPFSLSYRSNIGNDTNGLDYGYKLHLVYNALPEPSNRNYEGTGRDISPSMLSWKIIAKSVVASGVRPSAHFIVSSPRTSVGKLASVENILYGTSTTQPRMPTISELVTLLT